jgi:hypothetical protein
MNNFCEYFKAEIYPRLLSPNGNNPVRNRADSLLKVFEILEGMDKSFYRIIETGCMRADHGDLCFGDDGASTWIFDKFVNMKGGTVISIDNNPFNIEYAKKKVSDKVYFICDDSVRAIWEITDFTQFDLIYLDSYDIMKDNPHPSQLHHMHELAAVLKNAHPKTIIIVDDYDAFFIGGHIGKGTYVKEFMDKIGAKVIYDGYQIVFQL